jgi:hypothetical protein
MNDLLMGLVQDLANKVVAEETSEVRERVVSKCASDERVQRRAGIYLFGSSQSAKSNLEKLNAEIARLVVETKENLIQK